MQGKSLKLVEMLKVKSLLMMEKRQMRKRIQEDLKVEILMTRSNLFDDTRKDKNKILFIMKETLFYDLEEFFAIKLLENS